MCGYGEEWKTSLGLLKLLMKKFSRVNEDRGITKLLGQKNIDGLAMFWDMMDFCTKLLNAEWEVNQQEGEEFKCCIIWQMMTAMLHSDGQLRTERDGNTEKGCQKPALQQRTTDDDTGSAVLHLRWAWCPWWKFAVSKCVYFTCLCVLPGSSRAKAWWRWCYSNRTENTR